MLIVSDNTAANVLLDLVGMGEVNESLSRMKLDHTKLARRFMDFEARAARRDNVTSAGDMLALLSLIQQNMLPGARWLRETLGAQQRFVELGARAGCHLKRDWRTRTASCPMSRMTPVF